ncbi:MULTISPECIES: STAS domain-containing protein [unclassified Actinoplanes]|uniref:STAS domain-containing protein n=1 Tax=unclassified Actinoplanes TaxID=2626549 RepID=UPI000A2F3B70|nr:MULTISPECIES: STAS domain-containing protein [unclassified Actinoplanes]
MQMVVTALQVETVASRRGVRVRVVGEIDLATAGILGEALADAWTGTGHVDLDLANVSFLDCAGLRTLDRAATALGERLRLVAASETVCWMLRVAGLQWHLATAACGRQPGCGDLLSPDARLEASTRDLTEPGASEEAF